MLVHLKGNDLGLIKVKALVIQAREGCNSQVLAWRYYYLVSNDPMKGLEECHEPGTMDKI